MPKGASQHIRLNFFVIGIELQTIKSFLEEVMHSVNREIRDIVEKHGNGEYQDHIDDFGNALFFPEMRAEIAIRAVLNEINALVEWQLGRVAHPCLWRNKMSKHTKSKSSKFKAPIIEKQADWKDIIECIEKEYDLKLIDVDGFSAFMKVREASNAYKHRKGYKKPASDKNGTKIICEQFKLNENIATDAIVTANTFLRNLSKKMNADTLTKT